MKKTRTSKGKKILFLDGLFVYQDDQKSIKYEARLSPEVDRRIEMRVHFFAGTSINCSTSYPFLLRIDTTPVGCILSVQQNIPMNLLNPTAKVFAGGFENPPGYGPISYYDTGELRLITRDQPLKLVSSQRSEKRGQPVLVNGLLELEKTGEYYRTRTSYQDYY